MFAKKGIPKNRFHDRNIDPKKRLSELLSDIIVLTSLPSNRLSEYTLDPRTAYIHATSISQIARYQLSKRKKKTWEHDELGHILL